MSYLQRATHIMNRIQELAAISEDPHGITRTFGSPAFVIGAKLVKHWMEEAGLQTRIDNIGNVRGRWDNGAAKTFVIASHIDTVINAGAFDGPLGVLMAIDLVQVVKEAPFNIEIIAFSDEEGVRFHTTYLGSKAVTGAFDNNLSEKKDKDGITLKEVITAFGGNPSEIYKDKITDWLGYFEIHIEQGPILYERNIPVAVVSAIAGQKRITVTFKGMAGHAGTVPMNNRQDALCGAAEFILAVEEYAKQHKIVATVGYLQVSNAASNVIPGEVICSLDIRSDNSDTLETAYNALQKTAVNTRALTVDWQLVQETEPVICDPIMTNLLQQAIATAGYEMQLLSGVESQLPTSGAAAENQQLLSGLGNQQQTSNTPLQLVSGAGHDAVPVSAVSPVCMLFVKCFKGISHHPNENVLVEDIAAALKVSEAFMHQLNNHVWKSQP
jgi:allantoate deiminase